MSVVLNQIKESMKVQTLFEGVRITPTLAKGILELNTDNRPLSKNVVDDLSNQMKRGRWKYTGDTIKLSRTGKLLDGQHRLSAIVASNTAQTYNIQTGLDPDVFDVLDTGKPRSAGDVMAIAGYSLYGVLAGAIKIVISYDRKTLGINKGIKKHQRPSNQDVAEWPSTHNMELMQHCAELSQKFYRSAKFFSPPTYAGFLYLFSRKYKDQAVSFFEKLSSGENISAASDSAVYVFRQKLINLQANSRLTPQNEKYAMLIKAFNFYRQGSSVKRISWSDDEPFPRVQ